MAAKWLTLERKTIITRLKELQVSYTESQTKCMPDQCKLRFYRNCVFWRPFSKLSWRPSWWPDFDRLFSNVHNIRYFMKTSNPFCFNLLQVRWYFDPLNMRYCMLRRVNLLSTYFSEFKNEISGLTVACIKKVL